MSDPRIQQLIDWVAQRQQSGLQVEADTDLVASGALDSMGLVSLFFLVEAMGGQAVDVNEAVAAGPVTPRSIVARWF